MFSKIHPCKLSIGIILLFFASALLWACNTSPSKAEPGNDGTVVASEEIDEDVLAVDRFIDAFQQRYTARDLKGVSQLFLDTSDVIVDFDGRLTFYTIEDWLEMTSRVFKIHKGISDRLTEREITVHGEIAVVVCRYDFSSSEEHSHGHDIFSLVRTRDGWRIVSLMYSGQRD